MVKRLFGNSAVSLPIPPPVPPSIVQIDLDGLYLFIVGQLMTREMLLFSVNYDTEVYNMLSPNISEHLYEATNFKTADLVQRLQVEGYRVKSSGGWHSMYYSVYALDNDTAVIDFDDRLL